MRPAARIASALSLALVCTALASVEGCTCLSDERFDERVRPLDDDDDDDDDTTGGDDDDDTQPRAGCDGACADATLNDGAAAQCYACRCKEAFDGWLPSREELQCGQGVEVEVLKTVDAQSSAVVGDGEYPGDCNNPSLFQLDCGKHARYGVIERGDVEVRFLCRHFNVGGPPATYYDLFGVIGHNRRTGATCVWDAQVPFEDDGAPDFDITAADVRTRDEFAEQFVRTYGNECVHCHDNDPFIYTPYLKSVGWQTNTYTTGRYGFVEMDGSLRSTGMRHLVGPPEVQACTSCHRISNGETCALFARDAVGMVGQAAATVPHDFDPASAFAHAVWMPDGDDAPVDRDTWEAELGAARDKIMQCCDGVLTGGGVDDDCEWEDTPF